MAPIEEAAQRYEVARIELAHVPYLEATTSPEIAVRNLNASVEGNTLRLERLRDTSSAEALVATLHLRASILGQLSDLTLALEIGEETVRQSPQSPAAYELLALTLSALHRFDEAEHALDVAASYGADVESDRTAIALARGNWQPAFQLRQVAAESSPSYATNSDIAPALTAAGSFEEADAAFVSALDAYRDVSPFAVAWVQFQRGVLWGEAAGRPDLAEPLYQDAVRLMPDYVSANVHLAEIEAETGRLDLAIERLRSVEGAEDPEPAARLAEFLAEVDPVAAAQVTTEAGARWEAWLELEELAFADHAAEFYLGAGHDPSRALELAILNLDNRETDRSFELAVNAAIATGDRVRACHFLERAGPDRYRAGLLELKSELDCGP
ncbi:MAG: tetratricopeptide (TPR) repeat protein [Bradymonadia bacterium]|jgi:tetratricopeptide (TPR) repeat protein